MTNSPSSENSPNSDPLGSDPSPCVQIQERVRYSETDKMGVAHNTIYFEWFELGRTEFCRAKGLSYREIEERGVFLVVAESFCRYRRPLRYDDRFLIRTSLRDLTAKKVSFAYELRDLTGESLIAQGTTVHVAVDKSGATTAMSDDIVDRIRGV
jgi:acyl-CoA thioester hydrolase